MKRKILIVLFLSLFVLTSCAHKYDVKPFVTVVSSGLDGDGSLHISVDTDGLIYKIFKKTKLDLTFTKDGFQKVNKLLNGVVVEAEKTTGLSNGDEVKIQIKVTDNSIDNIKEESFVYKVEGLEEPSILEASLVEKHLVLNYKGYNGRGSVSYDNTLPGDLKYVDFEFTNDGKLNNGDEISVVVNDKLKDQLRQLKYIVEENFAPKFEVSNLKTIPVKVADISNLGDIKIMIDELTNRTYQDNWFSYYSFDLGGGKLFYRQFDEYSDNYYKVHGLLVKVTPIIEYSDKNKTKVYREYTAIVGYSNLVIDEAGTVNVANMENYNQKYDSTYSLNSVYKLLEGMGFVEVIE